MSLLNDLAKEFDKSANLIKAELNMINKAHLSTEKNLKLLADIHYAQMVWRDQWRATDLHKPYISLVYIDKLLLGANIARSMQENYVFIKLVFENELLNDEINSFIANEDEFKNRLNEYLDTDDTTIKYNYSPPIFKIQKYIKTNNDELKLYKLCSYLVHVSPKLVDGVSRKRMKGIESHFNDVIESYYLKTKFMLTQSLKVKTS